MHPVLVYSVLFISITIGLLFVFEENKFGSVYLLFFISTITTALIGKLIIKYFPSEDPMRDEIEKDDLKVRANQYKREIQYLFNIVQPDPMLQPKPKRLGESLEDCFDLEADVLNVRLRQYFGDSFNVAINQPLPDMVEEIRSKFKNWP